MSNIVPMSARFPTEIGNLFDMVLDEFWRTPSFAYTRNWRPTETIVKDDSYVVEIELPRIKKEEVSVTAAARELRVAVKSKSLSFERVFTFNDAQTEGASVSLRDGVLTLTVPRIKPATKQLPVATD